MTSFKIIGAAVAMLSVVAVASPASAQWRHGGGWHGGGWHGGGWHRGGGFGLGLATGAAIGYGAYSPYGYGYGYGPYAYGDDYDDAGVADSSSYCAQRYRSYDPRSGTYLGNDGKRHSCG